MNRFGLAIVAMVALIVLCYSCKKEAAKADIYDLTDKNELFKDLRPDPQIITIMAGRDTTVFGAAGTLIHFYAGSFRDVNDRIVAGSPVSVELTEMYRPKEMVQNRSTTTVGDRLLKCAGQINIKAKKEGRELIADTFVVGFKSAAVSTQNLALYYGNTNNVDSVIMWTESDGGDTATRSYGSVTGTVGALDLGGGNYHLFACCTHFGLYSAQVLHETYSGNSIVSVVMPDISFNPSNTQVFIVLPQTNSVTLGDVRQAYDEASHTFIMGYHGNMIPVGMQYAIVTITKKNEVYYFDIKKDTMTNGLTYSPPMDSETRANILTRLGGI